MSSSTSSSSSETKKQKVRRQRTFLGIRWPRQSSSSDSLSPSEGLNPLALPGRSSGPTIIPSGFMMGGSVNWANPEWDFHKEEVSDVVTILPFPCQVTCTLMIVSRKPISDVQSLLRKLELWVDQYSGSYVSRPYLTLIYILLGAKLTSRKSTSRNYEYHSKFQGVIRFGIQSDRNKPPAENFRLVMSEGLEDSYYAISFECYSSESKRKGVIYSDLYKMNGYHYTFPCAMELLGLQVVMDQEGLIASA
ncbi:matrix protein [Pararge aegeria rhabdovirus]|uniref:Matrix protein n=1 Tax=Pararge aegeria rhabdovirus TaxID=1802938 RepID=A0A140D8Q0_9RHAB|nr:matrix protein [Pararge aegeria rhabdovirus]AMK09274.1 matrix protein [Pararge aegeria rhabdovirus]